MAMGLDWTGQDWTALETITIKYLDLELETGIVE